MRRSYSPPSYLCFHAGCNVPVSGPQKYCTRHRASAQPLLADRKVLTLTRADLPPESRNKPHNAIQVEDFSIEVFAKCLTADEIIFDDDLAEMKTTLAKR